MRIMGSKKGNILTLLFYGVVGSGWFSDVSAEEVNREIMAYGKVDEIHVRIHSPGGSIAEGCAIYNTLKRHEAKIIVYIEGLCASIATVIAMAGDEIVMSPVSSFMIHNPLISYMSGGSEALRRQAAVLDTLKETIINAYATKTKQSREKISEMMDAETWWTAEEALENGFITKIEKIEVASNYIGDFKSNLYEKVPVNYIAEHKNKINEEEKSMDEIKNMTAEEFKNKFPDMFKNIKNIGVSEERERMKAFDMWLNKTKGAEEIINKFKYDDPKDSKDCIEELLNYVDTSKKNNKEEKNKNTLIEVFENKKKEYKASGIEELDNVDADVLKAKKLEKDIEEIVNIANGTI